MDSTIFEDFRDVLTTAAGNACRCTRSQLPATIARLTADETVWSTRDLTTEWPHLSHELSELGLEIRTDSSPENTRDQPWASPLRELLSLKPEVLFWKRTNSIAAVSA